MARVAVNDTELHYETQGDGPSLILVHGSWGDTMNWVLLAPKLAESYRVIAYDRRGHGQSAKPGDGPRATDEDDLVAVIRELAGGTAIAVGNSFGASVVLGAAARYPDAFSRIACHEPPLWALAPTDDEVLAEQRRLLKAVLPLIEQGRNAEAAERFVEDVALGKGHWAQLPEVVRQRFIDHAPTFLNEQSDPDWDKLDTSRFAAYGGPCLLSNGSESPPLFSKIIDAIAAAAPITRQTIPGAGHIPHMTHPDDLAAVLRDFLSD